MARKKDFDWNLPEVNSWDSIHTAVMMDIRDELKQLNRLFSCSNFLRMPRDISAIRKNTNKPVKKPLSWATPGQLAKRLGVSPQKLSVDLRHPRRPHVELDKYPSGRVRRIASNPIFEAFVTGSHKGRRVRATEVKS